jgi:DNA-binding LytR/AlgR family response regulator
MDASALIAEDEPLLATELRELKAVWPALRVVARAEHGAAAVEPRWRNRPGRLFLDIRMPGMSGSKPPGDRGGLARSTPVPLVVFVTAYDRYALKRSSTQRSTTC